jgi:hypothetical protein
MRGSYRSGSRRHDGGLVRMAMIQFPASRSRFPQRRVTTPGRRYLRRSDWGAAIHAGVRRKMFCESRPCFAAPRTEKWLVGNDFANAGVHCQGVSALVVAETGRGRARAGAYDGHCVRRSHGVARLPGRHLEGRAADLPSGFPSKPRFADTTPWSNACYPTLPRRAA